MRRIQLGLHSILAAMTTLVIAQSSPAPKPPATSPAPSQFLRCGSVFTGTSDTLLSDQVIEIAGGKIVGIRDRLPAAAAAKEVVDLRRETCMPGLIDAHTHVLLQGDIKAEDYDKQLLKESQAYRAIVGAQSAKKALLYGFTTIRDLETEGAGYADVDIKKAILGNVIPGPRMRVATRALDVTGAYPLQGYAFGIQVPHGVQLVDGPVECRKAVREQISYGADWIKVYVDRGYFVRPDGVLDDIPTFTPEELAAMVDEAHREGHPIAAHAMGLHGVHNAVVAGVDSIEHGNYIAPEDLQMMVAKGIYYVPTIYVGEYVAQGRAEEGAPVWLAMIKIHKDTFQRALSAGVKIAFGTDVGGFDWNIDPAIEFPEMVKFGMTPVQALHAATSSAAMLLRMQKEVGTLETGKDADIVAVPGDPLQNISVMQNVDFVMKGGKIYKQKQE